MKAIHLIRNTLLTGVCVGLLAGCSWLEDWPPKGSEMARKAAPRPPQSKVVKNADSTWLKPAGDETTLAGAGGQPRGLSLDKAAADRIASLEKSIDEIRNDLKMMMPALTKLAEAQGDIQKTMSNVEPAAGGNNRAQNNNMTQQAGNFPAGNGQPTNIASAANYQAQPGTVAWYEKQEKQKRRAQQHQQQQQQNNYQPPPQQQAYQPPPQQNYQQPVIQQANYGGGSGASITNVRFGEHPDKTRLVFDSSNKVSFSYDVDNNERILMISLPGAGWQAAREMAIRNSPLVASYNIVPDNAGGHQVIMQLKQPVKVLWAQALMPGGPQGHRVVFDLAAL